jgi:hypothetical protein
MMVLAARRELGGGVRQHPGSTTALSDTITEPFVGSDVMRVLMGMPQILFTILLM